MPNARRRHRSPRVRLRRPRRRRRPGRLDDRGAARRARPRRRRGREGRPPALSHRRVAAAGQRRAVRRARRARRRSRHRHGQVRRRVRLAGPRGISQFIEFGEAWDKSMPYAWQVRRSRARRDALSQRRRQGRAHLRGLPRARGALRRRRRRPPRSSSTTARGVTWRARFVVDASGRDTLLANQLRCKEKNPRHNSSALYGHFTGATRLPGKLEGNITIFWFEHGWFWFIPLADGTTSIGAVCWPYYLKSRTKPLAGILPRHDRALPGARRRASPARRWSTSASTRPATTHTRARRAAASAI